MPNLQLNVVHIKGPAQLPSQKLRLFGGCSEQEVKDWANRHLADTVWVYTVHYKSGDQFIGAIADCSKEGAHA